MQIPRVCFHLRFTMLDTDSQRSLEAGASDNRDTSFLRVCLLRFASVKRQASIAKSCRLSVVHSSSLNTPMASPRRLSGSRKAQNTKRHPFVSCGEASLQGLAIENASRRVASLGEKRLEIVAALTYQDLHVICAPLDIRTRLELELVRFVFVRREEPCISRDTTFVRRMC